MIERAERELHSASTTIARPVVIRLVSYVRIPRDTHRRKITRRAVFARDDWTCQYCGVALAADRRPRRPPLQGRLARPGRTSSPRARHATAARATRCRGRPGMHLARRRARRTRRLHPGRQPDDPRRLAAVPGRLTARAGVAASDCHRSDRSRLHRRRTFAKLCEHQRKEVVHLSDSTCGTLEVSGR